MRLHNLNFFRSGQRDCPRLGDGCVSPRDFIWAWARFIAEFLLYDCSDLVAWVNHTWFASAFDNDDAVYRIFTIVIMSGYLLFAAGATIF